MTQQELFNAISAHALTLPEAWEDHPWGETAMKVRKKVFLFLGQGEALNLSMKLPFSGEAMLENDFATPTGYGLGRHGWVSFKLQPGDVPLPRLLALVDEGYRAVAPKTLGRQVEI